MNRKLTLDSLDDPRSYNLKRPAFRQAVMAHKQPRRVQLGDHLCLFFEDYMTMKYQVQEMIRAENITGETELLEELEAYNPLIPDGHNWKATLMIEYQDVEQRRQALTELIGIEEQLWVRIGECERVYPVANEDLERTTSEKTSAVHFLRFELTGEMMAGVRDAVTVRMGCDHPACRVEAVRLPEATVRALSNDLH